MSEIRYSVPDISCGHCVEAIGGEVRQVPGVSQVTVDVDAKTVVVEGTDLDDAALRAAIDEAGYDIA
ncbi:heavy-metal-associated domain-containing protein [Actinomadura hibisca]|uniref:heavy-metal-associated domain-containing protein n=1 Tax=Actinomadura hibisca TaxID=68565 RepID=UPI00082E61A2|nr:heavy-metal-associated domain-containing protein [Actinomadura hibisca]